MPRRSLGVKLFFTPFSALMLPTSFTLDISQTTNQARGTMSTKFKHCPGHGKLHPITAFGKNICNPDGFSTYCKAYNNELQREWKEANPEKVKLQRKAYIKRVKAKNRAREREEQRA
jgi:DNA replication protein DnaC